MGTGENTQSLPGNYGTTELSKAELSLKQMAKAKVSLTDVRDIQYGMSTQCMYLAATATKPSPGAASAWVGGSSSQLQTWC